MSFSIKLKKCALLVLGASFFANLSAVVKKPNVLLIVCDDLNDYVETLGGHPQTKTPHLRKLIESGVSFTQAHCNIPICNPSRASFATCLLYASPSPRDRTRSRMPSSA